MSKSTTIPLPESQLLEPGDRLSRDEFERRYDALKQIKKAELIEGVVHMPSPVRLKRHGSPQAALITWLGLYWSRTPGVLVGDNSSIRLDLDNMPQPDGMMLIDPSLGGQARISEDDYVEAGPELIGEIAASTVSIDLHAKFQVYRRNAVREYIVWRVLDRAIDWFVLRESDYQSLPVDPQGILRSEVFPGLWLDARAMVALDLPRVLEVLHEGLATAAHQEFVGRLAGK